MRRIFFAFLLTFILFVGPVQADDDPKNIAGYGKTVWGMSEDEVLTAESPRVEKLDKPEKFTIGIATLSIKEIQIGVAKFRVLFIFNQNDMKLKQVILTSFEKNNPGINSNTFSSIEKLLIEKYGAPTYKEERRNASWKLQKTVIDLTHANISGIMTQVIVAYKPVESSVDASKNL